MLHLTHQVLNPVFGFYLERYTEDKEKLKFWLTVVDYENNYPTGREEKAGHILENFIKPFVHGSDFPRDKLTTVISNFRQYPPNLFTECRQFAWNVLTLRFFEFITHEVFFTVRQRLINQRRIEETIREEERRGEQEKTFQSQLKASSPQGQEQERQLKELREAQVKQLMKTVQQKEEEKQLKKAQEYLEKALREEQQQEEERRQRLERELKKRAIEK